jgi:nucleotide-binding universal stress UspA family protein
MPDTPILICYDGSSEADRAIDVAAALFSAYQAIVLDVGPVLTETESIAALAPVMPGQAFEDENLDDALGTARVGVQRAEERGLAAEGRAGVAAPTWESIIEAADDVDAAVIVLGSRGLHGLRELFEGSVSHSVAQHAHRPVLIVRAEPAPAELSPAERRRVSIDVVSRGPVLICYDGSPAAKHAVTVAGTLLAGRRAIVLDVGPLELIAETYAAAGSGAADISRAVFDGTLAQAEAGAALARHAGFDPEPRAEVDDPPWRGIIKVANEVDAELIVLGSDGRTGLSELIDGSVSHDVAEHARRPVLVIPPPATTGGN